MPKSDTLRPAWPSIPRGARERVVAHWPDGAKEKSEFRANGEVVGVMLWDENGAPLRGWGLRRGRRHGYEVEWGQEGDVEFAERYVNGRSHGTARQWDRHGNLLLAYEMVRGTGVELFCDRRSGTLTEETHLVDGVPHGPRRWWSYVRRPKIFGEEFNADGLPHGITRWWSPRNENRLARGYPKYFVHGEQVDKRKYVRLAALDPSLVPFRASDDRPWRPLPPAFADWLTRRARIEVHRR